MDVIGGGKDELDEKINRSVKAVCRNDPAGSVPTGGGQILAEVLPFQSSCEQTNLGGEPISQVTDFFSVAPVKAILFFSF